jgi:hypothetical protein
MTTSLYHYRVFGLTVDSEYELPELESIAPSEQTDVRIVLGETPPELEGATVCRPHLRITPQSLLLKVRVAGDFWVRDGKEIIVNPIPDVPVKNVRLFLLGSAFGAPLHQRGFCLIDPEATFFEHIKRLPQAYALCASGKVIYNTPVALSIISKFIRSRNLTIVFWGDMVYY